jgi:spoIIIJ-associated protein
MESNLPKIKSLMEDLLSVMDIPGEINIDSESGDFLRINIQSPDAAYLIGRSGENLRALQQICRAIINRKLQEPLSFIIDVNDYQRNHLDMLKEMALKIAQEVTEKKEPSWLSPMNAYERRIVHLTLADESGIKTESEGEGEERRIVIRPK